MFLRQFMLASKRKEVGTIFPVCVCVYVCELPRSMRMACCCEVSCFSSSLYGVWLVGGLEGTVCRSRYCSERSFQISPRCCLGTPVRHDRCEAEFESLRKGRGCSTWSNVKHNSRTVVNSESFDSLFRLRSTYSWMSWHRTTTTLVSRRQKGPDSVSPRLLKACSLSLNHPSSSTGWQADSNKGGCPPQVLDCRLVTGRTQYVRVQHSCWSVILDYHREPYFLT